MRKTLARMPTPAMAVAFLALLAALTGTAVALPGSNTVTTGDIRNGHVRTQDIRNSTVGGRDVRNNTLTGSDVNEGSLGTVPRANLANSASVANVAGTASAVTGRTVTGQAKQTDGGADITLASGRGFRIYAHCDLADLGAEVRVENTSTGGNEAQIMADWVGDLNAATVDEAGVAAGAFATVAGSNDPDNSSIAQFSAHGENGAVVHGQTMATNTPNGNFGNPDCVTSVSVDFR